LRTDNITYQISDLTGRNVLNGTLDKAQIHVASLQEGMYILHLQTSNGVITKRFVKI
jgi:hypothetical protein